MYKYINYLFIYFSFYFFFFGGEGGLNLFTVSQPRPQLLKWFKTFSQLFGPHDESLTSQWIITVRQIKPEKYPKESETRTRQIQCVALQMDIPVKSNNSTEENNQLNPGGSSNRRKCSFPNN